MADKNEFVIERVFNAPQELVYKMWADPAHLQKWFGPKGSDVKSFQQDFRVGGICHASMSAGNGPLMWSKWTYTAIEPVSELAWVQSFSDEKGGITRHPMSATWPLEMLTTVYFAAEGKDKTKITLKWLPVNASSEEIDTFTKSFDGMNAGWGGSFERLDDYLVSFKK